MGVSVQTVYLWVERKQIPHLRVMGRNIRFLKSDLEPFRATFKQEVGMARPSKHDGVVYTTKGERRMVDALPRQSAASDALSQPAAPDWQGAARSCVNAYMPGISNILDVVRKGETDDI